MKDMYTHLEKKSLSFYRAALTRIIHELRMPRCEASTYEAVLLYRKYVATNQMGYYRLAPFG